MKGVLCSVEFGLATEFDPTILRRRANQATDDLYDARHRVTDEPPRFSPTSSSKDAKNRRVDKPKGLVCLERNPSFSLHGHGPAELLRHISGSINRTAVHKIPIADR